MKFVLLAEGNTEECAIRGFLKRRLDPQITILTRKVRIHGLLD
jgi:hypothetical protein